jgi:CRP-like cAMP-binding protein
VAEGRLELSKRNRKQDVQLLMGIVRAPALLGDAELFGRASWSVTSKAVEPTTLVAIPNAVFDRAAREDLQLAYGLYRDASQRHLLVINLMQIMGLQSTAHRVLRLLCMQATQPGTDIDEATGDRIIRLETVKLARAVGVNRKTVARAVAGLERCGFVARCDTNRVRLAGELDIRTLQDIGEHGFGASWRLP